MKRLPMCAESMAAILAGKKDLTTRVVVPQPRRTENVIPAFKGSGIQWWLWKTDSVLSTGALTDELAEHAPYRVGERVALTEVWSPWADEATKQAARESMFDDPVPVGPVVYAADFAPGCSPLDVGGCERWLPAFLMRAEYARLFATITSVSAGRLHEMTYEDFKREGCPLPFAWHDGDPDARDWYMALWDRLNAKRGYPWSMNPWRWSYGVRREEPYGIRQGHS